MTNILNPELKQPLDRISSAMSSRRSFLGKALSGGVVAAAVASLPGAVSGLRAQTTNDAAGDIAVLNYALTLEHLEARFYVQGLQRFGAGDFRNGKHVSRLGPETVGRIHELLTVIRDHEVEHVRVLQNVITSLGGTPVGPCTYDFGYRNVDQFLAVAQALENTGVMAYDGAIADITSPALQTAGATIATVEARHAAYLNLINGASPFPDAFDTPKTMAEILAIASQFIVSCP